MTAIILALAGLGATVYLPRDWNRVWLYLIPAGLLVYGAVAIETRRRFCFPHWLRFIGDTSYSLYLCHMIPILLVNKVFRALNLTQGTLSHLLFLCVAITGAIALGAASYRWIEIPLLRWSYAAIPRLVAWSHLGGKGRH